KKIIGYRWHINRIAINLQYSFCEMRKPFYHIFYTKPAVAGLVFGLSIFCLSGYAQTSGSGLNDSIVTQAIVYNGDTIGLQTLEIVFVYAKFDERRMSEKAKYNR